MAFLLFSSPIVAQTGNQKLLFYHISEKDGLADNAVNCFFQDSRGVMWMGTQYGLNSFDGSAINTWRIGDQSPNNHPNNQVNAIAEDKHHNLWLATYGGLSALNAHTKKISSWLYNGSNYMRALACDGDSIWIATNDGLLLFNARQQTYTHFLNNSSKQTSIARFNNDCNGILLDSKKRIWLATVNGVWLFDRLKHTFEQYDGRDNDAYFDVMVNSVFEDHSGKIWAGCWSWGLKQIIPENHTVKSFNMVPGMPSHVVNIVEQKNAKNEYSLWLSGYLTNFTPENPHAERHDLKPVPEAASLDPKCLYISRDNLLWISTVKGVYILDPSRQLFKHIFVINQENITRQNPALFSLNGKLWVGGDGGFALKLFDDQLNLLKDYSPTIKRLKNDYQSEGLAIMNITPARNNDLWLSTNSGILKLDILTNKITSVCANITDSLKRTSAFFNNIFISGDKIWCFPWRRGIWQFNALTQKFEPLVVKLPEAPGVLKNLNMQDAVEDKLGNIWLTDLDYGLVKYTAATKKFARIVNKDITPYSRSARVSYIKNRIWLIANTTVVAINPVTNATQSWAMPDGMNKFIYDYTNDKDGNIWIGTRTGLVVFNTTNYSFNQYTEEDGLINNNMDGAIQKLSSGGMIFAGENYITSFNPADLLRTPSKKTLLLTGISAADTSLQFDDLKKVTVPRGSPKIIFKWALLNYTNPLQNRYYYKLNKIDKDWNYAGNKGLAEYNSLAPGDYKFQYKGVTADGLAGDEKEVSFTVEPVFWQTWWFRVALTGLLVACVLLIMRGVRTSEQRKAALQLQLSALEMKALRAQMNPHFIFNALNSIQECIVTKNTDRAYSYLSSFSKLVRMILENSEKQFISLADELETLRLYLAIEKLRFDDTFEFEVHIGPGLDTSFINLPAMIIQPFVENALWHGLIHKKGKKKLSISFEQEAGNLKCSINDNGIGRDHSAGLKINSHVKKQSMGVKITEERLQLLETNASISIADLKDIDGIACGTKVIIILPLAF
jgi:ligand-binding sensor domain-containing protein